MYFLEASELQGRCATEGLSTLRLEDRGLKKFRVCLPLPSPTQSAPQRTPPKFSQVKSVAGQDVSTWDFWDILEALAAEMEG